jgi:hypothetical protein
VAVTIGASDLLLEALAEDPVDCTSSETVGGRQAGDLIDE